MNKSKTEMEMEKSQTEKAKEIETEMEMEKATEMEMEKSKTEKATEMEMEMEMEKGETETEKAKATEMETEKATEMETEKRGSGSADFVTLRDDLFREVTNLVSEDPSSKIAILFSRPGSSSESDVSMFSFGCPSADDVVKKFLSDSKSPDAVPVDADDDDDEEEEEDDAEEEDQSSSETFWWEDPKLLESEDLEELKAATDSMAEILAIAKARLSTLSSGNQKDLPNDNAEPKP